MGLGVGGMISWTFVCNAMCVHGELSGRECVCVRAVKRGCEGKRDREGERLGINDPGASVRKW